MTSLWKAKGLRMLISSIRYLRNPHIEHQFPQDFPKGRVPVLWAVDIYGPTLGPSV